MKLFNQLKYRFGFIFLLPLVLILYTNMGIADLNLVELLQESEKVAHLIDDPTLGHKAKELLVSHKTLVSNSISLKVGAQNCAQLLNTDENTHSGRYIFHPSDKSKDSFEMSCEIANGQVLEETLLRDIAGTHMSTACVPVYTFCYNGSWANVKDSCGKWRTIRSAKCSYLKN